MDGGDGGPKARGCGAARRGAVEGSGGSASPRLVPKAGRAHAPRGPSGHRRDLQIGSKPRRRRRLEDLIPSAGFVGAPKHGHVHRRPALCWRAVHVAPAPSRAAPVGEATYPRPDSWQHGRGREGHRHHAEHVGPPRAPTLLTPEIGAHSHARTLGERAGSAQ